jgi:DNA-binding beta-propeller fold protein YncE
MNLRSRLFPLVALLWATSLFAQGSIPEISYDTNSTFLKWPERVYLGEPAGVAVDSKRHVWIYTRTGSVNLSSGTSRTFARGGARLFEFDQNGNFVREIGQDLYGFVFAERVRIDPQDNIWVVDSGSNMVIKFDPQGRVLMTFGRKPEAVTVPAMPPESEPQLPPGAPVPFGGRGFGAGSLGDNFNRPSDVAWDAAGDIFIADGHGGLSNARIAKFDKDGRFIKTWGSKGAEPGQFDTPHAIAVDARGSVYVGDRGNKRIQVFDNDGNFKTEYRNVGSPFAICITPGPHQYLYSSNSNFPGNFDNGEIYKMELDGTILGKFGAAGKGTKEFGTVHTIDCRSENEVYVGEILNWRVQRVTLHGADKSSK